MAKNFVSGLASLGELQHWRDGDHSMILIISLELMEMGINFQLKETNIETFGRRWLGE